MVTRVSYQRARKKGPGTIHETDLSFLFLKRKHVPVTELQETMRINV